MYVGASSRTVNDGGEVPGNMEEAKAKARAGPAAMPVAQQQQFLFLQQLQRQKQQEAIMSRFPSNIDAHLRPQQHLRSQSPISSNPNPNPNSNPQLSSSTPGLNVSNAVNTNFITNSAPTGGDNSNNNSASSNAQQQHQKVSRANQVELQMSYQDAWRVCHPDFKRPFSSLEDACERLLPYHVVADYEAEEDDKILDSDTNGQILSRSQQWDHNIAAKVAEFTATFEKQVLAFNIISHKRDLGEFRTEEKLMIEQLLLQEERRVLVALRQEIDARQKAGNLRMASSISHAERVHAESQAQAELMGRASLRPGLVGSQASNMAVGNDMSEQENPDEMMNGWGDNNGRRGDEKEPSDDFLNDEETEAEDGGMQSEWHGGGDLDLN